MSLRCDYLRWFSMFKPIWQTKGHTHFSQHGTTSKTSHPTCLFVSPMLPLPSFTKKRNCHWVAHQRNQTSFHVRWHRHRVWVQQTIRLRTFACFRIRVSFVIRFCWSVSTLSCAMNAHIQYMIKNKTYLPPSYILDHLQMSHEKNPLTFHYTGWLIGILIMVYYDPYITG